MSIKRRRLRVDAGEYKIGRGKPPRHCQYKPGQSGYPSGRPKGSRNFKTAVKAALKALVKVTCDGKSRKVSTMEAMILRLKDKALGRGGDLRALSLLIQLAQLYSEDELAAAAAATSADDANVLRIYRARLSSGAAAASESASDNDQPKGDASGSTALAKTLETTPTKRVQVKRYRPSGDKPSADDADQHK